MKITRFIPSFLKRLGGAAALSLVALITPLAQAQNQITVEFGSLYGASHIANPTTVTSGTGLLGSAMQGNDFYWVCLDQGATSPNGGTYSYTVSDSPTHLNSGIWGTSITSPTVKQEITRGVANMFSFYRDDLMANVNGNGFNETAGTGFQVATWYITEGYTEGVWSGELNAAAIDSLITWNGGDTGLALASFNSWIRDMLAASQIDAPEQQVFFANPTNSSSGLQSVAIFPNSAIPVPEPGSAILVGFAGLWGIMRRRRSHLAV